MNMNLHALFAVIITAFITVMLRAFPFIVFGGSRRMPAKVKRVADGLPPAIIGVLVVYCLKDSLLTVGVNTVASLIAVICIVGIHIWKKNTLLSIALGTFIYMILLRVL